MEYDKYELRNPLTGQIQNMEKSTVEYLEQMRSYCKEKGYSIQEIFQEEDEEKLGFVPQFAFLYIIRQKFSGQKDFSLEQVRIVCNFLNVPDGNIWYVRLHIWMKSDETVLNQVQKVAIPSFVIRSPTPFSPALVSNSSGACFAQPFNFGNAPPQPQQQSNSPASFGSTATASTGIGSCIPAKDATFSSVPSFSFQASPTLSGNGTSYSNNASIFGAPRYQSATSHQTGIASFGTPAGTNANGPFGAPKATFPGGSSFGFGFGGSTPSNGSLFGSSFAGSGLSPGTIQFGQPSSASDGPAFAPSFSFGSATPNSGIFTNFFNPSACGETVSFGHNQPSAQPQTTTSDFGGGASAATYSVGFGRGELGTSPTVNAGACPNGTIGLVTDVLGSGDATNANSEQTKEA